MRAPSSLNFFGCLRNSTTSSSLLRLIRTGDIAERDLDLVGAAHARAALAERHDASAAALRLLHDEEPDADEQQDGDDRREHLRDHQGAAPRDSPPRCRSLRRGASGRRSGSLFGASGVMVVNSVPSASVPWIVFWMITTFDTSPLSTCCRNCVYSTSWRFVFFVEK